MNQSSPPDATISVTWFASPERANGAKLNCDVHEASTNVVMTAILDSVSGLLAVLNEQRQVIALNENFLKRLGLSDGGTVFGLRPGEVLKCIHAHEEKGGCGTSKWCSSCGAAIAIVTALATQQPEERKCRITAGKNGNQTDLCFNVRAFPLVSNRQKFILLFLQDITGEERMAEFERAFSHDLKNIIFCLVNYSGLMKEDPENAPEFTQKIHNLSIRLARELKLQESLRNVDLSGFSRQWESVPLQKVISDIRDICASHPAAEGKRVLLPEVLQEREVRTDLTVMLRIVTNMVVNALEASQKGDEVRVWIEDDDARTVIRVWNRQMIPEDVARRVFERHYSTKPEPGRGIGTYAMKMLGEKLLGGNVFFTTNDEEGTTFSFSFPPGV